MPQNVWKYGLAILALLGLVFLLHNISILENWNCSTVSALSRLQSHIHTSLSGPVPVYHHNHTYCARLGQKATPEEEREEHSLLNSITWPGPPFGSAPVALLETSDPAHSSFTILPSEKKGHWYVGDQLEVIVQVYDFKGRPKGYGGDFLLARLHSPEYGAGVAGVVSDHKNGLYSVRFLLLWEGSAQVEVTMVHSSEAVAVLQRLREERPDRVYFNSLYRLGHQSQTTVCNMCLPPDRGPLCDYTDPRTGEPWYCYKPRLLSCHSRINHAKGGYLKNITTDKEARLFQSGVNIKVPIRASGNDTISVLPSRTESKHLKPDAVNQATSGYYYQESWRTLGDIAMRHFDSSAIAQCLTNKVVHLYGDSTIRQWFDFLVKALADLKEFNLRSPKMVGPFMAVDSTHNILVKYRCHGPPIRFSTVMASELRYISNELDGLTGGPNTVVAISIWSHFSTFPVEVYIRRLRHIRKAVAQLLDRAPGTLVVIRSANPQALDQQVSLYNSDWFSQQLDAVLRAMFKGLDVLLVDAWQMSVAHHHPHLLHPPPAIVKNTVDLMLSYVCP
uniref:NXPE family member 3-like n=1 Tax=Doryrhamphus excisus TaxID=161450 RepID=UPI0025ADAA50|nr:NXPE family member 3-like [Doryrhamphus excisus]